MAQSPSTLPVYAPEDQRLLASVALASVKEISGALQAADGTRQVLASESPKVRSARLKWIAKAIQGKADSFAQIICDEAGNA